MVKCGTPRFEGHTYPRMPLWGFEDESDPSVMQKKIETAAAYGVDVFLFDWYLLAGKRFFAGALERGFLPAANNDRVRFAVVWVNGTKPFSEVTPAQFDAMCEYVIERYFRRPSYWKIGGRPYFSVFDLFGVIDVFGSMAKAREAIDRFRAKVRQAGFPGLYLDAVVVWRNRPRGDLQYRQAVAALGADSVSTYCWIQQAGLPDVRTDYRVWKERYFRFWDEAERAYDVPYYPNVSLGWDRSQRYAPTREFDDRVIVGNTPQRFAEALRETRDRLAARPRAERIVTIYAWNEWGEGAALEPDTVRRFAYLEAVRKVFRAK